MNRSIFPLIFCLILVSGCRSTRPPEAAVGASFHVLTYNVNWGAPRPELAAEVIRASGADVVCLQETTPQWEQFLRRSLAKEYPFAEFRQSRLRFGGGLAYLAKKPGKEVAYVPSNTGWFDGWLMAFQTAIGSVQVLNVHLRPPVSDSGSFLAGYLTTSGDFNDVEKSEVLTWLRNKGMVNALPAFDRGTATWHWHYGLITLKRRMDHIVYSPELHCCSAKVIRAGASDHFPVEAVFTRTHSKVQASTSPWPQPLAAALVTQTE